jgi:hypothetical protein
MGVFGSSIPAKDPSSTQHITAQHLLESSSRSAIEVGPRATRARCASSPLLGGIALPVRISCNRLCREVWQDG